MAKLFSKRNQSVVTNAVAASAGVGTSRLVNKYVASRLPSSIPSVVLSASKAVLGAAICVKGKGATKYFGAAMAGDATIEVANNFTNNAIGNVAFPMMGAGMYLPRNARNFRVAQRSGNFGDMTY